MTGHPVLTERLARLVRDEHLQLAGFVELLKQEEALLVENSIDPLLTLASEKTERYRGLQRLSDERVVLFARMGIPVSGNAIRATLSPDPEALALWNEVVDLAREAHRRNALNGRLIAERLQNNQQALTTLLMAAEQPQIYGPDGQARPTGGSRHLGSV